MNATVLWKTHLKTREPYQIISPSASGKFRFSQFLQFSLLELGKTVWGKLTYLIPSSMKTIHILYRCTFVDKRKKRRVPLLCFRVSILSLLPVAAGAPFNSTMSPLWLRVLVVNSNILKLCLFKEAQRIFPSVPYIARRTSEDCHLGNLMFV